MSGSYDLNAHFNKSVGSCELILSASNRDDQKDDVVFKARLAEDVQENGLAKGVKPGEKGDPFRAFRFAKQACLIGVWICIGLSAEIVGPTIPDLMEIYCVNYEEISRALAWKSIGLFFGSIFGGFLNEILYTHVDLFMSLSLMVMGVACFLLPRGPSLAFVAAMLSVNGFGEGIINTGGNTMVMDLWGENAASPMHSLHFGFGFGAFIAPLIARPFLSPDIDEDDENYTLCADQNSTNATIMESESRIEVPYGIIGILVFLFAIFVLVFYIMGKPNNFPIRIPSATIRELLTPESCSRGYVGFGVVLLTLLFFYFIQAVGGERAYGKFLFSFATEAEVQFTKDEASYLQSAFWGSFTLGRLLGIPLAKYFTVNSMIIGDIIGNLITAIVLSLWGASNSTVLWVFSCFMGLFVAVVFPNGMSWSNIYLDMNSMAVMILLCGGSVGGFFYTTITGSLFENVGPETLMYVMVAYAVLLAIVYILMQSTASIHVRRRKPIVLGESQVEVDEDTPEEITKDTFDDKVVSLKIDESRNKID